MKCFKNTGGILKKKGIHYTELINKIRNTKAVEIEKTIFSIIFFIALTIGMWVYLIRGLLVYLIYPYISYCLNYYH